MSDTQDSPSTEAAPIEAAPPETPPAAEGQAPVHVETESTTPEAFPMSEIPPMPETPLREFADHMDAERQHLKDWVRKELHLLVHGMSHEDRLKENP